MKRSLTLSFLALIVILMTCGACNEANPVVTNPNPSLKGTQWHYTVPGKIAPKTILLQMLNDTLLQRVELMNGEVGGVAKYAYAYDGTTLSLSLGGASVSALVDSCKLTFVDKFELLYGAQIPPVMSRVTEDNSYAPSIPLMSVLREGDNLYLATKYSVTQDLVIWFKHCMFNQLMTFYQVGLIANNEPFPTLNPKTTPTCIINRADSDNIGPMLVQGSSWIGGNHSLLEDGKTKTANSLSYAFLHNGNPLSDGLHIVESVDVTTRNTIVNPLSPDKVLCNEQVNYSVVAGQVTVSLAHTFLNEKDIQFRVYYGMQSMANGSEFFIPMGATTDFESKKAIEVKKSTAPLVNKYIQRDGGASWYEAAYLHPDYGIGDHSLLGDTYPIYLQSGVKMYHSLFWDHTVKPQTIHTWKGTYTWFLPVKNDKTMLAYVVYMNGKRYLNVEMKVGGTATVVAPFPISNPLEYSATETCEVLIENGTVALKSNARNSILITCD